MLATAVLTPSISDLYLRRARSSSASASSLGRFRGADAGRPLYDILLAHRPLLGELVEYSLLVLLVVQFNLGSSPFLRRRLDIRLKYEDVLPGLGELRLDLLHLVFVGAAVELEQRLALLHREIFFDQHRGDEGRLGQARNELDGVLDDRGIRGIGGHEPQANHEHQNRGGARKSQRRCPMPG